MPLLPASAARRGFTMVELLVVIGIIAVLMGLLIPTVMIVKSQGLKTKTRSLLGQVSAAAEKFNTVNGLYPETDDTGQLLTMLTTVEREAFQDQSGTIKDAWKYALKYRSAKFYEFTASVTDPRRIDGAKPPKHDSFQVWSVGPNGREEVHGRSDYGDDLVGWK